MFVKPLLALALAAPLLGTAQPVVTGAAAQPEHPWAQQCEDWDEWDKPGPAFTILGNTHYVGTCGIAAILITSDQGHVLIDSGTEAGAELVLANIRKLGFDPADVKLLLNSHEHFDHVGGMAGIQEATGAPLVTSPIAAETMRTGEDHPEDPQFGLHEPMRPVGNVLTSTDPKAQFLLNRFGMWPIFTPGHTPGAMSWTWRTCEGDECRTVVYADSMSAVSSDDYRFSDHQDYLVRFLGSLNRIRNAPCDILLTPHPSGGNLQLTMALIERRAQDGLPQISCFGYAERQQQALSSRLAKETEAK